jgi:hypothetical protein
MYNGGMKSHHLSDLARLSPRARSLIPSLRLLLCLACAASVWAQGPAADGIIEFGEYESSAILEGGRIEIHWSFDPTYLSLGVKARTRGWVAIGFGAQAMMEGADMALGWAGAQGGGGILDQFSVGITGPHPSDGELGGEDSIVQRAWSERDGTTLIEFKRPRAASDAYDKPVSPGDPFIWALGRDDDPGSYHESAGSGSLVASGDGASGDGASGDGASGDGASGDGASGDGAFGDGASTGVTALTAAGARARLARVLPHAASLVLAFLLMTAGMLVARFGKRSKRWLPLHKALGYSSAALGAVGLMAGIVMVQTGSGRHLRVPHAFLGAATLVAVAAAPILGKAIFAAKARRKEIRALHPWVGRAAILLMVATIVSGLAQAGILGF